MQNIQTYKNDLSSIFKKINRYARKFARYGVSELDDIAQDALVKVLLRKDERVPTDSWLYMTVRSAAFDLGRKHRKNLNLMEHMVASSPRAVYEESEDYKTAALEPEYDREIVESVLAQLSPSHREVLMLYASGQDYADIASNTGAKIGTVRSRLHYARRRAWQILKEVS